MVGEHSVQPDKRAGLCTSDAGRHHHNHRTTAMIDRAPSHHQSLLLAFHVLSPSMIACLFADLGLLSPASRLLLQQLLLVVIAGLAYFECVIIVNAPTPVLCNYNMHNILHLRKGRATVTNKHKGPTHHNTSSHP